LHSVPSMPRGGPLMPTFGGHWSRGIRSMAHEILLDFTSPCGAYRLTFEDDGKVAYAYLLWKDDIVGDVWLYNRCPTPDIPEWTDRTRIPFANPREFVGEGAHLTRRIQPADVVVDWKYEG